MKERQLHLWVVMFRGVGGWLYSFDTGNPFQTQRAARKAVKRITPQNAKMYRIVKFVAPLPKEVS